MTENVVADIYARLSQDDGIGSEREAENVEFQIARCTEFIESKGWTLGRIWTDNNVSATKGTRPGFEEMLKSAPPIVVYRDQDRLERGFPGDLDRFCMGGSIGYGMDGSVASFASADSELMTRLRSTLARHEQMKKAERIRESNLRYARLGRYRGTKDPFGNTLNGERVEPAASAIEEAAVKFASGEWSLTKIAATWNEQGLTTPKTSNRGGKPWTFGAVKQLFKSPRLMGYQDYKGERYKLIDWEALVSEEDWHTIQRRFAARATGVKGRDYRGEDMRMLTRILTCPCGEGLRAGTTGKGRRTYFCAVPPHHFKRTAEPMEKAVADHALSLLAYADDAESEVKQNRARVSELQVERMQLIADHEAWIDEAMEASLRPKLIRDAEERHQAKVSVIDAELLELDRADILSLYDIEHAPQRGNRWAVKLTGWDALELKRQRELVSMLITRVDVEAVGQGKRFHPSQLTYHYTPLGAQLLEAWESDFLEEVESPEKF